MKMKLEVFDDESVRIMGRWLPFLDDFLEYIQQQLSGLYQVMTTKISSIERFTIMEGSKNHTG